MGPAYLTRAFFSLIGESMAKDVLLVMAKRNGRWIAGAINFIGSDTLFGRNWGAIEHHPFLHFEVCYYQAIDFAITTGPEDRRGRRARRAQDRARLSCRKPRIPRITSPTPVCAARSTDYLRRERAYVAEAARELSEAGPFRKTADEPILKSDWILGDAMPAYDPQQPLRQNPARRISLLQGV